MEQTSLFDFLPEDEAISRQTHSEYLKRDYAKYIKRLQKEMKQCKKF